jgi:hypothetical protein
VSVGGAGSGAGSVRFQSITETHTILTLIAGNTTYDVYTNFTRTVTDNAIGSLSATDMDVLVGARRETNNDGVWEHTYSGWIFEILMYNTTLSDEERLSVERYLYNKWIAP